MKVTPTALPEVLLLEPRVFGDARGFFMESFNARVFREATGVTAGFVQDNHSQSRRGVLRGIHYQVAQPQGKLVRVVTGAVLDVAVDLRRSSPRFGQSVAVELTADNRCQLWIPPGFGHAFIALSEVADFLYKTTEYWIAQHDRAIRWDDPQLAIAWPAGLLPIVSDKDAAAPLLRDAEVFD
ncbi:MAG: dTDP-4-dehydrorhamnose 3,5-epimerase [Burkholderiaceae bacterium]|jgi:dTDP-4-dehydrorhamnose 3,5-epimerase|nr:dTDP-4-dehydrorhamnose 3,5-epimerase [Burkholderiales bacterium]MCA3221629.1 dTDP-4-dehydrorhamnose 3,5-epimerase [Burkholderiales bacterium]MCA3229704.1 dTDP-4-dehydrorhamnose 3,5-epimerase [Burkholderiales bacterium]MCE2645607.1 dTDP-4-dehydrorhamnose 3,5-epimerase [Burkholderiaceae bacterium]